MTDTALLALSPLDGRYASQMSDLSLHFSEFALIKKRLYIEIEYLIYLADNQIISSYTSQQKKELRSFHDSFSNDDATEVKAIENKIHHDVKAVEYFLREKMIFGKIPGNEYIHICLTSEDTNNLAYSLTIHEALHGVLLPSLKKVLIELIAQARTYADATMLAKTHGQPAVPTTMGKELIVFATRLANEVDYLSQIQIEGKLNGAVGNFNAQMAAYPDTDWLDLSTKFVISLGLEPNRYTTQILPPDSYVRVFQTLSRINCILLDLNQDMWRYISDGVFTQKINKDHVGSSTMPQKVNPIDFENSEGNLGLANAVLNHLAEKLPISRLQRDLSDSTVKRSIGTAFGYSLLAYTSCLRGLKKIQFNKIKVDQELEAHYEVITEGIQSILRTTGDEKAYEKLKELSRGRVIDQATINTFIESLDVDEAVKNRLKKLTPQSYVGLAKELVKQGSKLVDDLMKSL